MRNPRRHDRLVLVSGTCDPALSREVAEQLGTHLEVVERSRFANGEICVRFPRSLRGADVFVIQSICDPVNDNLVELLITVDALKRASAGRVNVVAPLYGYSRQDRKATGREPITAKLVANLLTAAGADRIVSFDLHAPQIQGFFDVPFDHLTAAQVFVTYFAEKNLADLAVVSPDVGRVKLSEGFANELGAALVIVHKSKEDGEIREMRVIGEIEGKRALVVDDMIDGASTLVRAVAALKEAGADEVYACATHAVLSGDAVRKLAEAPIEEVVFSNTVPIPPQKMLDEFTVLSIGPHLADAVRSIHEDTSVSQLFL